MSMIINVLERGYYVLIGKENKIKEDEREKKKTKRNKKREKKKLLVCSYVSTAK